MAYCSTAMDAWKTFGHEPVKTILTKQLLAKRFAHAYLFSGPEGVGKKQLALEFAQRVLQAERLNTHPDFQILNLEGEIVMQEALAFIGRLSLKPFLGPHKVAIINNAQNLNSASGNALLKTLEEPSSGTVIILISTTAQLLPTIVSRCQSFAFYGFSEQGLREFARAKGLNPGQEAINFSFGSITRLLALCSDKQALEQQVKAVGRFGEIRKAPLADRLLAVSDYANLEAAQLQELFTLWLQSSKHQLSQKPESYRNLRSLQAALEGLGMNKNKKLILQSLFLKI